MRRCPECFVVNAWTEEIREEKGKDMAEMAVMGTEPMLKVALKDVPPEMIPEGIKGGDTKLIWSKNNRDEVESARRTFDELKKKGFSAFAVKKDGEKGEQIFSFDETAEKLIMVPAMRGGC
jgi:hypothetical protein